VSCCCVCFVELSAEHQALDVAGSVSPCCDSCYEFMKVEPQQIVASSRIFFMCSICHADMNGEPQHHLACNHTYHQECLEEWLPIRDTCPNCRAPAAIVRVAEPVEIMLAAAASNTSRTCSICTEERPREHMTRACPSLVGYARQCAGLICVYCVQNPNLQTCPFCRSELATESLSAWLGGLMPITRPQDNGVGTITVVPLVRSYLRPIVFYELSGYSFPESVHWVGQVGNSVCLTMQVALGPQISRMPRREYIRATRMEVSVPGDRVHLFVQDVVGTWPRTDVMTKFTVRGERWPRFAYFKGFVKRVGEVAEARFEGSIHFPNQALK